MNEIAYCPHEFFARFRHGRKETYAVCESCGGAYCSRHIERVHTVLTFVRNINDLYYCL
jgi:hypothetical protein